MDPQAIVWLQLDYSADHHEGGVLCRVPIPLRMLQDAWSEGPEEQALPLECWDEQQAPVNESHMYGLRAGAWLVVAREALDALIGVLHLLLWLLLVACMLVAHEPSSWHVHS